MVDFEWPFLVPSTNPFLLPLVLLRDATGTGRSCLRASVWEDPASGPVSWRRNVRQCLAHASPRKTLLFFFLLLPNPPLSLTPLPSSPLLSAAAQASFFYPPDPARGGSRAVSCGSSFLLYPPDLARGRTRAAAGRQAWAPAGAGRTSHSISSRSSARAS